MTELQDLINKIERGIATDASYIYTIKNPQLLVTSLKELNDVIGNHDVKNSIALQISHLIMEKRRAFDNPNIKDDDTMLNTILYGPPGVGKTLIGTKLAKIWLALGFLENKHSIHEKNKPTDIKSVLADLLNGTTSTTTTDSNANSANMLFLIAFFILVFIMGITLIWTMYTKFGAYWAMLFIIILVIFIIFISSLVMSMFSTGGSTGSTSGVGKKDLESVDGPLGPVGAFQPAGPISPTDDEVIKVVSRADFVDKYVGHTAIKTNNLLRENTGKVLFIDEAYSLFHGVHDEFGMEALTALNLYMSQHPRKTLVIMAGYKDLLEDGIFSAQPGLQRRFMWQFDCSGYDAKELATIFLSQIRSSGWDVHNSPEISALFEENYEHFPAYGGDTSKLSFYAKLEHSKEYLKNSRNMAMNILTTDNVKKGLIKLQQNNIQKKSKNDNVPVNPLSALMKAFKTQTA